MPRRTTTDEVQKLLALNLLPGESIPWEALEEVTGLKRRDRRFQTVYRALIAWLRKWRNCKVIVEPGKGLRVLHERERAGDVKKTVGRTWPILQRATTDADEIRISQLEGLALEEAHHVRHRTHRLRDAAAHEMAEMEKRPGSAQPSPAPPRIFPGRPEDLELAPQAS